MELYQHPYELIFKHPFGVSSNTRRSTVSVLVAIKFQNYIGYGEACIPAYLGESLGSTQEFLKRAENHIKYRDLTKPLPDLVSEIDALSPGHNAAKAAVDIALHDLYAKSAGCSVNQMLSLEYVPERATAFTIGIDHADKIRQKIEEASDFALLKIKAGTPNDRELIKLVRSCTSKPLYVDANQGWRDKKEALELIFWLKDQGVTLIEQPMPVEQFEDTKWLCKHSPLPIYADESVKRQQDLDRLLGCFNGINIKLMKSTGLTEAIKMIQFCKREGIAILLGCMAESSCGTGAMTQLLAYADVVDLDAPLLYTNDPFEGVEYTNGNILSSNGAGIGVRCMQNVFKFD